MPRVSLPSSRLLGRKSAPPALHDILQNLEERREERWLRQGKAAQLKLQWRAAAIQQILHTVPGETILELGAGSGLFAEQFQRVVQGENPLTSVVFSPELCEQAKKRRLPAVDVLDGASLPYLLRTQFDYVIGFGMLWHARFEECLGWIHRALKPGGQMLFFEPNFGFLSRWLNELRSRPDGTGSGRMDGAVIRKACRAAGFDDIELTPHDIVSCRLGSRWMTRVQSKAVLLEHMPGVRSGCASLCLLARKHGQRVKPEPCLANLPALYGAVSVVVPAHNEAANIPPLLERLFRLYGPYIHEVVIVNDNSTDETAEVVRGMADERIRLVNRSKPNGVGRALKDGYRAATGRYILSMDCDFVEILPQFRPLFQTVANGRDGAIGSRFSHESILINYPFSKLFFNRLCHLLIKLFLVSQVRDITNNLKLYRTEILKGMEITSGHFSANLETGLKPLLAGYNIVEIPISWINRTAAMGSSSFSVRKVGPAYARALMHCWIDGRKQARGVVPLTWRRLVKRFALTFSNLL